MLFQYLHEVAHYQAWAINIAAHGLVLFYSEYIGKLLTPNPERAWPECHHLAVLTNDSYL